MKAERTRTVAMAILVFAASLELAPAATTGENTNATTSAEAVQKEMAEAIDAVREYSAAQREQAVDEANEMLAELDAYIGDLEARIERQWDRMSDAARERAQNALARLKAQRAELAASLDELQASSSSAWEQMKQGFVKSYRAMRDAFEDATDEF